MQTNCCGKYCRCAHINNQKIPTSSVYAVLVIYWDYLVHSQTTGTNSKSTGWQHRPLESISLSNPLNIAWSLWVWVKWASLPSQLLFRYTDTNTGGTVKKSTTEFTSSQNHSLSLAAINCWNERLKDEIHSFQVHRWRWKICNFSFTYAKAEVQQEEHVECHVDLQREVFVEVLTGLDRAIRDRNKEC